MENKYSSLDTGPLESFRNMETMSPGILKELIETFVQTSNENLEQINDGIVASNCEAVWKSAHSLKSSSAALGANKLAELAKEIEELGQADQIDEIKSKAVHLKEVANKSLEDLKDYLACNSQENS